MATIKYRDSKGVEHILNPYKVYNVIVNQEKGDSELDVMSQKAVTAYLTELDTKINNLDAKTDDNLTYYYTKSEVDEQHSEMRDLTSEEIDTKVKIEKDRATDSEKTLLEYIDTVKVDLEQAKTDTNTKLDTKVSWSDENYNKIELPNHGQIYALPNYAELGGKYPELGNGTLLMLSKYNNVEVGTAKYPLNLNGAKVRPTYNEDESLALLKDVTDLDKKTTDAITKFKSDVDERFDKDESIVKDLDLREKKDIEDLNAKVENNGKLIGDLEAKHDADKNDLQDNIVTIANKAQSEADAIKESLKLLVNDAKYDKDTHRINFYHDEEILAWIDASDFIRDGMVNKVQIVDRDLVIEFNVDAGLDNINIPLDDIFNPDNYYNKDEVNAKVVNINSAMFQLKNDLEKSISNLEAKHDDEANDIKDNISDIETELDNINQSINSLDKKVDNNHSTLSDSVNDLENNLTDSINTLELDLIDKIDELEAKHDDDKAKIDTALDNKIDWSLNKSCIVLPNHGMILGSPNYGEQENKEDANGTCNLVMLSKWNVTDFGSVKYPINLNGKKQRPTYNDTKEIALVEDIPDVSKFFDDVKFDKIEKRINFYQNDNILAWIDATDFVKDGMVRKVLIADGNLQIQFNADSELDTINIPLTDIFNPDNYYTKVETDAEITGIKVRLSFLEQEDVYINGQINNISEKIETLRDDVSHIHDDIRVLKQDVVSLQDKAIIFNSEINDLKDKTNVIDSLIERVGCVEEDNEKIVIEQAKLERDNENINSEIGSVKLDISNVNSNISHINDDIDDINERLRKLGDSGQDMTLFETKLHAEQTYSTKDEVTNLIKDLQDQITELKDTIKWYEHNS